MTRWLFYWSGKVWWILSSHWSDKNSSIMLLTIMNISMILFSGTKVIYRLILNWRISFRVSCIFWSEWSDRGSPCFLLILISDGILFIKNFHILLRLLWLLRVIILHIKSRSSWLNLRNGSLWMSLTYVLLNLTLIVWCSSPRMLPCTFSHINSSYCSGICCSAVCI